MSDRGRALVVDDEPDIRELFEITFQRMGLEVRAVENLHKAYTELHRGRFDICLTDMRLPDGDGIQLVEHIQHHHPRLPVAVITAYGNMEAAIRALKAGAFDFVSKPVDLEVLRRLVSSAIRSTGEPEQQDERLQLVGRSQAMGELRETIGKLARSQAPIYISGESGSGKELVARLIHMQGPRSEGPFVPVNCGAIPTELVESEFFGHRKGSFTGATSDKAGLFQAANEGTLFLDEVADLPVHMQVKLLRAIQEKAVRPVGAQKEVPVDVRILSATHKDMTHLVREGVFREDLYYRINVIQLPVPSLRERPEDIPELARFILERISRQQGVECATLTPEAEAALKQYRFPGNVRELENILERAVALNEGGVIRGDDLRLPEGDAVPQVGPLADATETTPGGNERTLPKVLDTVEKQAILQALDQTRWNRTAAARQLGLTPRQLRYRLKKLGVE
jgi:two-component system response regulator PilR (NtrC family)